MRKTIKSFASDNIFVARDWDRHYSEAENLDLTPAPLLVEVADMLPPGRALDLACGAGRNAIHLVGLGWRVTAVDASPAAIRFLRRKAPQVDARIANLETGEFAIEPGAYDLICDFFYLQRDLFPAIRNGVRPGGTFAGAIHLAGGARHSFVMQPGELRNEFAGWKILFYSEAPEPGGNRRSARIIARRA
jgi:tellurite methyltransferase